MGHSQSSIETIDESSNEASLSSPIESLIAEAAAYGDDKNESVDARAAKALECPCIAELRKGPCGSDFSAAFLCFIKSSSEEKGSDCINPFVALQNCIKANPHAFPKDVVSDEKASDKQEPSLSPRIIPPKWAMEAQSPKPRL